MANFSLFSFIFKCFYRDTHLKKSSNLKGGTEDG